MSAKGGDRGIKMETESLENIEEIGEWLSIFNKNTLKINKEG